MDLRLGIIGLGGIAERFAGVAKSAKGVSLAAVASRERARSESFAARFGAAKVCDSYQDLIRDPEVDAVYIALTHNLHFEYARLCLEEGKAVLCEKPLVTARKDALALAALSRERKVLLMEAMWTRCIPAFRMARQWVLDGRIGSVKHVQAAFCIKVPYDPEHRLYNRKLAGGALYDLGVYPIEFATGIVGENPSSVAGSANIGETGVDYSASISLGFPGGAVASLACGFVARAPIDARVFGDEGSIAVYDFLGSRKCELYDAEGGLDETFESAFEDGFIFQIEHFAELYKARRIESDLIPLEDSIACAGVFDILLGQWGLR